MNLVRWIYLVPDSVFYFNLVHLHNKLLIAIIHNSQKYVAPPTGKSSLTRQSSVSDLNLLKRKNPDSNTVISNVDSKRRSLMQHVISLNPEDKNRISSLPKRSIQAPINKPPSLTKTPQQVAAILDSIQPDPKLCLDIGDLPGKEALRSRMRLAAQLNGLKDSVGDNCVSILSSALEVFIC